VTLDPGAQATVTVTDNDHVEVGFSAATASVGEAAGTASLTVALDRPSSLAVTVDYDVIGGTVSGSRVDYTLAPGSLTFAPGETSKTIALRITDDALHEPDETLVVGLSKPQNAILGANTSLTLTIVDNDNDSVTYLPLTLR
jgi:hypothetical protein